MGGRLNAESFAFGDQSGADWAAQAVAELATLDNVRMMPRCTVMGAFDHGIYGAVERVSDHLATPTSGGVRQTLWRIYAGQCLLTAGATERPIAFDNNDRPGIMLAGSLRAYANRWAAVPGKRVAVFTNNDDGLRTATDLSAKGVEVAAVIDTRRDAAPLHGIEHLRGAQVVNSTGRLGLKAISVRLANGSLRSIPCDALGVSGGWNPNVHLTCHQRGRPVWDDALSAFVPGKDLPQGMRVVGAAAGQMSTAAALTDGAGAAAAMLDLTRVPDDLPKAEDAPCAPAPFWYVTEGKGKAWLDQQNDVTVKDIKLAHREGFRSVEHLKRYTTLGMATDQGKTANVPALAVMAELTGKSIPETGTTIFRPPYTPVALAAFGGRSRGKDFRPTRLTPSHDWAVEQGAVFTEAGQWLRAQWFPKPGETHWRQSVDREARAVRTSVGICDVTTLGKIDVQGADAATFLNRLYCNGFAKLPVGKCRYGLMLREDGIAEDDGTAARFATDHFVVTTTTAKAGPMTRQMEFARQCLWPELDVQLISTTDAWAQFAIAGPNARRLLAKVVGQDISNDAFPFMACAEVTIFGGLRARLFRISFSGELAYELAVPRPYGDAVIRALMTAGAEFDVTPYGTEALGVLRIEKGHATGNELNGRTTAQNLGMGRMVSTKKDSIGAVMSRRAGLVEDPLRLVGLKTLSEADSLPAGAHLTPKGAAIRAENDQGYVSSACWSPHLRRSIGLGFLTDGEARHGEIVCVANPLEGKEMLAEVVSPHFIDPEGERLRV